MSQKKSGTTRRRILQSAAAGVAAAGLPLAARAEVEGSTEKLGRIAVIGAGMGGISAAYFLDPQYNIDLFESRGKIGGHADSITFPYKGKDLTCDLGAQFCHPDTHPLYMAFLEEMGLYRPQDANNDQMIDSPGSVSVFNTDTQERVFVSTHPLEYLWTSIAFAIYTTQARNMIERDGDWYITVEEWINGLWLDNHFKYDLLLPWISALIGTTVENARASSMRSILQTFALAFPKNLLAGAKTYNSLIGLGGNVEYVASQLRNTKTHLNSGVKSLSRVNDKWMIETTTGETFGPYDSVVLNVPPHTSKKILENVAGTENVRSLLNRYVYFPAKIVIHEDAIYMPDNRRDWAAYNGGISSDGNCEGSARVGALHNKTEGADAIEIFKSWAYTRTQKASKVIAERSFMHPWITPDVIAATRDLKKEQGKMGLYYSGQYTTGMDLQEAALYSGMQVAKALAPNSKNLTKFQERLKKNKKDQIEYTIKA